MPKTNEVTTTAIAANTAPQVLGMASKIMPNDMQTCPRCGADMDADDCAECGYPDPNEYLDNDADDKQEAALTAKARNALPDSSFGYIDQNGGRHFPLNNAAHVRNALARLAGSKFSPEIKAKIMAKIRTAAKKFGVHISEQASKPMELVETYETPIILEQADDGYHRARFLVTTVGQRNKNGRVYGRDIVERELQYQMRGDILGQDTHPADTPKFTEQFLIWEKFLLEGDKEFAVAKVVPTEPDGKNFILLAQAGAMASCSRRGMGSVKEGTVNGQKAMIVQNDYKLIGIDILPPHTQSDHNAYLQRFEAYAPDANEFKMDELTLDALRESREDIVTAIEAEATKPLADKIAELETTVTETTKQVEAADAAKVEAVKLAQETQTKLDEATAAIAEMDAKFEEATKQVAALNEAAVAAKHLLEKVKGEKAAWLILDELKDAATVADVDAKFEQAKQRCDALIENAGTPAGKATYAADENAELKVKQENDKAERAKRDAEILEKSKRIARPYVGV